MPFAGRRIVPSTMHGKELVIGSNIRARPDAELCVPDGSDTDALGPFSGEVARQGRRGGTAVRKARLGPT